MGYSGASVNVIDDTPEPEEPVIEEIPPVIEETPEEQVPDISNDNSPTNDEETNNGEQDGWSNLSSESTVSSNASLKSMQLDVVGISPNFNKNTTSYWITVPTAVDSIEVTAIPEDANATVSVEGNYNLADVQNYIYIRVTAEDGVTRKVYTINVTRSDNEEEINADLNSLAIEGVLLEPEFREDIMEYTVNLESDLEKLNILAFPKIEGASVVIEGNENLKKGENIITIKVLSVNGENEKIYTVKVNKNLLETPSIENKTDNQINNNIVLNENMETKNNNKSKNVFLVILVMIIIIIVAIIIIKKYKGNKNY